MVKKTFISLLLLALLISFVSAVDTEIKIKTLADHKVSIFVYPDDSATSINSFHITADSVGSVSVTHSSGHAKIDLLVKVTKDGNKVFLERFEDYIAGNPISIRVDYEEVSGTYDPQAAAKAAAAQNTTVEENVTVAQEKEPSSQITGEVVAASPESSSTAFYFVVVIGILAAIVIVLFVIKRFMPFSQFKFGHSSPSVRPSSSPYTANLAAEERRIKEVERKIVDAQKELNVLKGQERIKAAEKRLEMDRRELEKLKFGIMGDSGMQRRTSSTFQRVDNMREIPLRDIRKDIEPQKTGADEVKRDNTQQQDAKKDDTFDLTS